MARKKKQVAETTENKTDQVETRARRPRGYVVRFPHPEARLRAIDVLGKVELPVVGFPDPEYGVQYGLMPKHVEALERERIPFEVVS
jgi:hypothetical protein